MTEQETELEVEIRLLQKVGEGDRQSFEALYDKFSGVLFSTAYKVLNNSQDAQDVLQDVFVQIWEKAGLYDSARGKPLTWAMTMTRNKAIDRLRSAQRRTRLKGEAEKEADISNEEWASDASDEVSALERSGAVRDAVMLLSKDQREAIEMAFFRGLTQNEIADALDQPLGTVKARIRRGMMKLKTIVKPRL